MPEVANLEETTPVENVSTPEPIIKQVGYPTIMVDLPSKGYFYPPDHPFASGIVELRHMTAKDEDILTTESYIRKGIVLDRLFENLLVTKGRYEDLLVADREALMIAARANAYGEIYTTKVTAPSGTEVDVDLDLNNVKHLPIDTSAITIGHNRFEFKTPISGDVIIFKLPTISDQKLINETLSKSKRADQADNQFTARLINMVQEFNGITDRVQITLKIRDMLAKDARALRNFIKKVQPGLDLSVEVIDPETFQTFSSEYSFGLDFFWPDAGV